MSGIRIKNLSFAKFFTKSILIHAIYLLDESKIKRQ